MDTTPTYYIVDDDRIFARFLTRYLGPQARVLSCSTPSHATVDDIVALRPDAVILDIMMPEIDGHDLCRRLRAVPALDDTKIIVLSGKAYEFDREKAFSLGADGYLTKPVDPDRIAAQIRRIMDDRIEMTFWGVRGTLPVPGERALRYGGNTSCMTLVFPRDNLFIFDAGTGIKALSRHLLETHPAMLAGKIFISHPHWDHINGLPFFTPLYLQGNEFEVLGPAHTDVTLRELIAGQMDGVYFPIKIKEFGATVSFRDLREERITVDGLQVDTLLLNHPGNCLGYRVHYKDRSVCYVTDNELFPPDSPSYNPAYVEKLVAFVQGANALVTDSTYKDDEYPGKERWGHSPVSQVAALAHRARVKALFLCHHDPDQTDDDIDQKLATARTYLDEHGSQTECIAPKEQQCFQI